MLSRITTSAIVIAIVACAHGRLPAQPPGIQEVLPAPKALERLDSLPEERPISQIGTHIAPAGDLFPRNIAQEAERPNAVLCGDAPLLWAETVYFWDAPAFCYRPLYYEEVNIERYGYTHCKPLQPFVSAAHFATATAFLPYQMTVHRPLECIYPLGHYRPGSAVPFRYHRPELRADAALVQAGTVAGIILLVP